MRKVVFAAIATATSLAACAEICEESVAEVFGRLMEQTSNSWLVSQAEFSASANSNMAALASMHDESAEWARSRWLTALSGYVLPTNDYGIYRIWMHEKTSWLNGCASHFTDCRYTNLWLQASCLHGDMVRNTKSLDELRAMAREEIVALSMVQATGAVVSVASGMPMWFWHESRHTADCLQFAAVLKDGIVEQFGIKGIPMLPSDIRWGFYSNFVDNASLGDDDCARIRSAIESSETH